MLLEFEREEAVYETRSRYFSGEVLLRKQFAFFQNGDAGAYVHLCMYSYVYDHFYR